MSLRRSVERFMSRAYSRKGVASGLLFWTVLALVLAGTFVVSNIPLGLYTPTIGFQDRKHRVPPPQSIPSTPRIPAGDGILRAHNQRIIAIGDLNGDIDCLRNILRAANVLVKDEDTWREGCTDVVVQLGNVVGHGPDVPQMMQLLSELKPQALASGGRLITLSGNHELLALSGAVENAHPRLLNLSAGSAGLRYLYGPDGRYGRMMIEENLAVAVVSDIVFVHGGLTAVHGRLGVDQLNAAWFEGASSTSLAKNPFHDKQSPLWDSSIVQAAMSGDCGPLSAGIAALKREERIDINLMVVGHTPMKGGMVGTWCAGKLMTIDVSMSRYVKSGGYEAFLSFHPMVKRMKRRRSILDTKERLQIHYPLGAGVSVKLNITEA
ncbi:metallo-dependent phosphatase-like protein [Leishmania panamensis]|uniref:Metallo-dependent phosphatase-like protein n=1 Tax=Leishmania panamensis TaxID=5679 RepID=A0A088RVE1_LEIPA|nr:metallo-dependent phosphatase-like protein [Leishmania panamensis]AIN99993.1 metallo-dependent phosphatase-like protein [Leishmania panamensis]